MNNKLQIKGTQEFLGINIPVIHGGFGEDQKVILAKTVAEIHDMEVFHVNELINKNIDEFEFGVDILDLKGSECFKVVTINLGIKVSNRTKNFYLLSEQGYLKFYSLIRNKNENILFNILEKYFNNKPKPVVIYNKEIRFREKLKETLSAFDITDLEFQKSIPNRRGTYYRIDCFIPSLNIAIEYDEDNHRNYSYDKHEGRQKEIEDVLNCKFIRVTDENSHEYNIGCVIKNIFNIQ